MSNLDLSINEAGELLIPHDGKKVRLTANGLFEVAGEGFLGAKIEGRDADVLLHQTVDSLKNSGSNISKDIKKGLSGHLDLITQNVSDGSAFKAGIDAKAGELKTIVGEAERLSQATDPAVIKSIIAAKPEAVKFLSEEAKATLETNKIDLAAIEKELAEVTARAERLKGVQTKFTELMKGEKVTVHQISDFMKSNGEHIGSLTLTGDEATAFKRITKLDFGKWQEGVIKKADKLAEQVTTLAIKCQTATDAAASHSDPASKAAKELGEQAAKFKGELETILKHDHIDLVKTKLSPETLKTLKTVDSGIASKFGAVGAKAGGNFWTLMHSAEKQAELLAKKGGGELGFFEKLNKGKTALVAGAAVILAAIVAGVGNKGEHAEQVSAGRGQEPEAAPAR